MTTAITSFNDLKRQIPLIQSCIDNPSLSAGQKEYNKFALQYVVDLVHINAASDYSWDAEAAVKECKIKEIISNFLNIASDTPLTANHVFSYLKLNKL